MGWGCLRADRAVQSTHAGAATNCGPRKISGNIRQPWSSAEALQNFSKIEVGARLDIICACADAAWVSSSALTYVPSS